MQGFPAGLNFGAAELEQLGSQREAQAQEVERFDPLPPTASEEDRATFNVYCLSELG